MSSRAVRPPRPYPNPSTCPSGCRFCLLLAHKVSVKWSGKKFDDVEFNTDEPALVFKSKLFSLTGVAPDRQKIMIKGGLMKVRMPGCHLAEYRLESARPVTVGGRTLAESFSVVVKSPEPAISGWCTYARPPRCMCDFSVHPLNATLTVANTDPIGPYFYDDGNRRRASETPGEARSVYGRLDRWGARGDYGNSCRSTKSRQHVLHGENRTSSAHSISLAGFFVLPRFQSNQHTGAKLPDHVPFFSQNATLQCLRAIPELHTKLALYHGGVTGMDQQGNMTAALRDLYSQLGKSTESLPPMVFLQMLRSLFPQFAQTTQGVYAQQDAHECWSQIVSVLKHKLPGNSDGSSFVDKYMSGRFDTT
ncbi:MAG: hypothetical protein BJ554DRAFT_1759 [Olpidium bornovanus]|uniref:ubiquitinyl hydrolase 1 n=1 Tax=Olpidium bornovanus TaxID=278681 RepID=A0A8H8DGY8_9FUNG|nr:MAG: hypothetical protein BJ554DRAFT_1759 [Olpidium bornovanus]